MDERQKRVGLNEVLFREVNARLGQINETFSGPPDQIDMVCECGQAACIDRFSMDPQAYRELRADARTFAIKPGHEVSDVEDVVSEGPDYIVVRKRAGGPAELAEAEDLS